VIRCIREEAVALKFSVHTGGVGDSAKMLISEGLNELVQDGYNVTDPLEPCVVQGDQIICAVLPDGELIGVICYEVLGDDQLRIKLTYVEPSSRRQGVMTKMLEELVKEHPLTIVRTRIHAANEVGLSLVKGMAAKTLVCEFAFTTPAIGETNARG